VDDLTTFEHVRAAKIRTGPLNIPRLRHSTALLLLLFDNWFDGFGNVSGAWAAKKLLRAQASTSKAQTHFCNLRSRLRSCSALRSVVFSATPAHRYAQLHPSFGSFHSVFRSAYASLTCSVGNSQIQLHGQLTVEGRYTECANMYTVFQKKHPLILLAIS